MKLLLSFFVIFLVHCHLSIPTAINQGTQNQSDPEDAKTALCLHLDELSSCTKASSSDSLNYVLCVERFDDEMQEMENTDVTIDLTSDEQSEFESATREKNNCTEEIVDKVDEGSINTEKELLTNWTSCVDDFTASLQTVLKCE